MTLGKTRIRRESANIHKWRLMMDQYTSVKTAAVAKLPLKMNLQFFAEEPTEPVDPVEPTDPVEPEEPTEPQEPVDPEQTQAEEPEPVDPVQDDKTNAAFAEMRRKAEAADKKLKEMDAWVAKTYGDTHGFKTWEEYQAYVERENERAYYEEKGVDPDVVEEIVNKKLESHPSVKAARQKEVESYQAQQMSRLNDKYDLGIKSLEDIQNLPNADAMIDKIRRGYDWDEAYLVTHQEHVTQKLADKSRQATLNNQKSKEHLKTKAGGGDVDTFVMPQEVLAEYRRMFSKELRTGKMTEKDFISHYRKANGK